MKAKRKVEPTLVLFDFEVKITEIAQLPRASALTKPCWG